MSSTVFAILLMVCLATALVMVNHLLRKLAEFLSPVNSWLQSYSPSLREPTLLLYTEIFIVAFRYWEKWGDTDRIWIFLIFTWYLCPACPKPSCFSSSWRCLVLAAFLLYYMWTAKLPSLLMVPLLLTCPQQTGRWILRKLLSTHINCIGVELIL